MAEPEIRSQPFVGTAGGAGGGRHLVWPDDGASWMDFHRSIHNSASLRALYDEQVSAFGSVLLLSSGACVDGFTMDSFSDRSVCFGAPLGLAGCCAARSSAHLRALLASGSG